MEKKYVFVVRWLKRIDGEEECGNFEFCYKDEKEAEKKMLEDMENTKKDWEQDEEVKSRIGKKNGNGCSDYCGIWIEDNNTYDYHDWYIDKLPII